MKKILSAVALSAMIFGAASGASAATYDLFRVVYNVDDTEVGLNLGQVDALTNGTYGAGTIDLSSFATSDWADVQMSFVAGKFDTVTDFTTWETNGYADAWWGSSVQISDLSGVKTNNQASSIVVPTANAIDQLMGANTISEWSSTNLQSYQTKTAQQPTFIGTWLENPEGAVSLDALGTGGTVDMYLYHATAFNGAWSLVEGDTKLLTMAADGALTVADVPAGSPVPLPGAVWLLGSGLMGIVGLRRKNS